MKVQKIWIQKLKDLNACSEGIVAVSKYPSINAWWQDTDRADWMLWLIGKTTEGKDRKKLVIVACQCARLALPYVPANEERPLKAIEPAERWARGEGNITLNDVMDVANVAYVAYAANVVAYAVYAAVDAAVDAANVADAAADAANVADAARKKIYKQCADIIRAEYPAAPEL